MFREGTPRSLWNAHHGKAFSRAAASIPHVCSAVRLLAGLPTQSPAESRPSDNQDVVPIMEPVSSLRSTFAMPTIALPPAPPLATPPLPVPPLLPIAPAPLG